jgi:hypothetical protein
MITGFFHFLSVDLFLLDPGAVGGQIAYDLGIFSLQMA